MSTNFAKTLVWKQDYDIKLWRHKQRTTNTNDYPMSLNETPPWKFSAYATTYLPRFLVSSGCIEALHFCRNCSVSAYEDRRSHVHCALIARASRKTSVGAEHHQCHFRWKRATITIVANHDALELGYELCITAAALVLQVFWLSVALTFC